MTASEYSLGRMQQIAVMLTQHTRSIATYGRNTAEKPSAMLVIRITRARNESDLAADCMISCSVDARWAPGINVCTTSNSLTPSCWANVTHTRPPEQVNDYSHATDFGFWPKDDGSWRTVSLSLPWLNNLTPSMNESDPYQTTLTTMVDRLGLKNETGNVAPFYSFSPDIEAIVASVVVDGMLVDPTSSTPFPSKLTRDRSRIGLQYNDPYNDTFNVVGDGFLMQNTSLGRDILRSDARALVPPFTNNTSASNATKFEWRLHLSGYVYKADSPSAWVALVLLLLYSLIAIAHTILVVRFSFSTNAWKSSTEMLLLSQKSQPPTGDTLRNAAAGVECLKTMSQRARVEVRMDRGGPGGQSELQLVFKRRGQDSERRGGRVEDGKAYGDAPPALDPVEDTSSSGTFYFT